jgi:hypothetical protein
MQSVKYGLLQPLFGLILIPSILNCQADGQMLVLLLMSSACMCQIWGRRGCPQVTEMVCSQADGAQMKGTRPKGKAFGLSDSKGALCPLVVSWP